MIDQHIASAFDRDLENIQSKLMKMGGLVEVAINDGARALLTMNDELADKVHRGDKDIDAIEQEINEDCVRLIALRQPIASDLRVVLSVMKVAASLERIGDYAKNMGKRARVLTCQAPVKAGQTTLKRMAVDVQALLGDALNAYIRRDLAMAQQVRQRDVEIDQQYNAIFLEILDLMTAEPEQISACMHFQFIAKNMERMGDLVTSIAAQVVFLVTGEFADDERPKATSVNYVDMGESG